MAAAQLDGQALQESLDGLARLFSGESAPEEGAALGALESFCHAHANTQVFHPFLGAEAKSGLLGRLLGRLGEQVEQASPSTALLRAYVHAIRLLLRDPKGSDSLLTIGACALFARLLGLPLATSSSPSSPSSSSSSSSSSAEPASSSTSSERFVLTAPYSAEVSLEAARVIFNIFCHGDAQLIKEFFGAYDAGAALLDVLTAGEGAYPEELRAVLVRILGRATASSRVREGLLSVRLLRLLCSELDRGWAAVEDPSSHAATLAVMKLLTSVTLPLGPLNITPRLPSDEEFEVFRGLVALFQSFLFLPRDGPRYDVLRAQTVSCLINVPARCTDLFHPEKTLEALIYVLGVQLLAAEASGDAPGSLVSVLLVLTSIAKAIPRARAILKHALFPADLVDSPGGITQDGVNIPHEVRDSGCMASRLIPYMCSLNTPLKQYASELLFEVCDEDPSELIRLTGFGYSAGLLATQGFINPEKVTNVETRHWDPEDPSTSDDLPEEPPQELLDLMRRLEDRGLLKVVTKDGTPFDYDACAPPDPDPTP